MRDLYAAAARQCAARRNRTEEQEAGIRESIFRRLMGGTAEKTESTESE